MPAAMYTIDRDGRITFYNDQAAELWGCRPNLNDDERRFCGSHKLLWPDGTTLPHDKTPMVDALQNGTALHGQEVIIERSDGTRRHVIVHIDPLRNAEGHIVGAVNLFTDMTARKQVEDALRASEERFRMLAEAMPHFVWLIHQQGETEFENQRWYDYTGLTHETMTHDAWLTVQHPEDAPRLAEAWKQAVETGEECDAETRFRRAVDGIYRWFRVRGVPVRDAESRIQSWVRTCTDIHDRKEAELALRESEERYRATFANAPVGISHIGLDGRWLRFNDSLCTITGYFREELLAMTFADITYPGDLKAEWAQAHRALAGEIETYSMEERYVRKDGSLIWVHKTVSLLRDARHRSEEH